MRLLLARHGQTAWNLAGRVQGHADAPLSRLGEQQAARLRLRLARERIDAVYASDLQRCWRTAEIAAAGLVPAGRPIVRESAWRELAFGAWEGLTYEEATARDPERAARRLVDPVTVTPPGGENLRDLDRRIGPALDALVATHDGQTALLVTHGGPLRVIACRCLEIPLDRGWRLHHSHCGLSVIMWYDAGPIVEAWNETAHLQGLPLGERGE